MSIEQATSYRDSIIELLKNEKLPTADLPDVLDNFIISKHNDQVTGVAGLEIFGNYGLLRSVAVKEVYRSRGIAGKLVLHMESIAKAKQLIALYLLTETATIYFEKMGYKNVPRVNVPAVIQQSSQFTHACPQSASILAKSLINL